MGTIMGDALARAGIIRQEDADEAERRLQMEKATLPKADEQGSGKGAGQGQKDCHDSAMKGE